MKVSGVAYYFESDLLIQRERLPGNNSERLLIDLDL